MDFDLLLFLFSAGVQVQRLHLRYHKTWLLEHYECCSLKLRLSKAGQEHLLDFWNELEEAQQVELYAELRP